MVKKTGFISGTDKGGITDRKKGGGGGSVGWGLRKCGRTRGPRPPKRGYSKMWETEDVVKSKRGLATGKHTVVSSPPKGGKNHQ